MTDWKELREYVAEGCIVVVAFSIALAFGALIFIAIIQWVGVPLGLIAPDFSHHHECRSTADHSPDKE